MREQKFRVWVNKWDSVKKEHVLTPYIEYFDEDGTYITKKQGMKKYYRDEFTSIQDKHGVDMYEADIVKGLEINGVYSECVIVFAGGSFMYKQLYGEKLMSPMHNHLDNECIEVIGNIHK